MTQPPSGQGNWWQAQGYQPAQPPPVQHPGTGMPHQPPDSPQAGLGFGGGFPSQYAGLGAFDATKPPNRRRRRRIVLASTLGIVALAATALALWLFGTFGGPVLAQDTLQREVTRVMHESYGEHDVTATSCPADQPIDNGHTFDCTLNIDGQPKVVTIRVLNDRPEFEIGAPH